MKKVIFGACVSMAFTAGLGAQDQRMGTVKMDHMAMEKTYSGCVESSQAGSYSLTHSMIADTRKSMGKSDSTMKGDPMMKNDAMAHDGMAPASLALSAAAPGVNLSKHVGHKVTVTGTDGDSMNGDSMNGMATFKVKSIKMIGASCS